LSVSSDGSGGSIESNHWGRRVGSDTGDWHFKSNGDDVGVVDNIVSGVLSDSSREDSAINGNKVDKIEDFSDIDGEGFSSLANKDFSSGSTSGKINVVDILARVVVIVGEGLGSGIIKWLLEVVCGGSRNSGRSRSISSHNIQSIVLEEVQSRVISNIDWSNSLESDGHVESLDVEGDTGAIVGEFVVEDELISDLWSSISGLINVDFVVMSITQRIKVGSSVGRLTRIEVGD